MSIYKREINGATVDVYDILAAYTVKCPASQHAIKKLLMAGQRGHKDIQSDLSEARRAVVRAIELSAGGTNEGDDYFCDTQDSYTPDWEGFGREMMEALREYDLKNADIESTAIRHRFFKLTKFDKNLHENEHPGMEPGTLFLALNYDCGEK